MTRNATTWRPGCPSPNVSGKLTLGERVAARTISEAMRELVKPEDVGKSLLAIFAGVDPFTPKKRANPDNLPESAPVPIDWQHRMAAMKLYLEYAYGKPLQGVVVDAQVRQETVIREERRNVVELRAIAATDPAAREALRTIARAMLGAPSVEVNARDAQAVGGLAHGLHVAPEAQAEPADLAERAAVAHAEEVDDREVGPAPAEALNELDVEDGETEVSEDGAVGVGHALGDLHEQMIAELDSAVKAKVRLPGDVL